MAKTNTNCASYSVHKVTGRTDSVADSEISILSYSSRSKHKSTRRSSVLFNGWFEIQSSKRLRGGVGSNLDSS